MGEETVRVAERYEDISLPLTKLEYQTNLHDSIPYGLARGLEDKCEDITSFLPLDDYNRVLPEGYSPNKWYGEVEDWAITSSDGSFCIGQSVSIPEKPVIPGMNIRKDFYQAKMFERRVNTHPLTAENLQGVYVVNIDEGERIDRLTSRKEKELEETGSTDIQVVITELEPSGTGFEDTKESFRQLAGD